MVTDYEDETRLSEETESDRTPLESPSENSDGEGEDTIVEIQPKVRTTSELERLRNFGLLRIFIVETGRLEANAKESVAETLSTFGNTEISATLNEPMVYVLYESNARALADSLEIPASYVEEVKRSMRAEVKVLSMLPEDRVQGDQAQAQVYQSDPAERVPENRIQKIISEANETIYNQWVDDIGGVALDNLERRRDIKSYGGAVLEAAIESELIVTLSKAVISQYCIESNVEEHEINDSLDTKRLPLRVKEKLVELVETRAKNSIEKLPSTFKLIADATNPFKEEHVSELWEETLPFTPIGGRLASSAISTRRTPRPIKRNRSTLTKERKVTPSRQASHATPGPKDSLQSGKVTSKGRPNLYFSSSSEESDEEVNVNAIVTSTYDPTKETQKIDSKAVPQWGFGETQEEKFQKLEQYVADLILFNSLGYNCRDSRLIFLSLNASGRSYMTSELPSEALNDLNAFITHIQEAYGRSMLDLRLQLSQAKQKPGESPYSWMTRLITCYYRSKRQAPKSIPEIMERHPPADGAVLGKLKNPEIVSEILQLYLHGLYSPRVLAQLRMDLHNLTLDKVCERTKDVSEALNQLPQADIHAVAETTDNKGDHGSDLVNQIAALIREKPAKVRCNFCKRRGHTWKECHKRLSGLDAKQDGKPKESDTSNDRCFGCGAVGHWKKDCQKTKQANTGSNNQPVVCYRCGRRGHIASSCRVNLGRATKK